MPQLPITYRLNQILRQITAREADQIGRIAHLSRSNPSADLHHEIDMLDAIRAAQRMAEGALADHLRKIGAYYTHH